MTYDQINGEDSEKMLSRYYFFLYESCSVSIKPIVTKFPSRDELSEPSTTIIAF